jgi:hypothetical protein
MTTPMSIQGLASVPSPFTHPMMVCSVPCAARPAMTAPARTSVPRTVSFMTPPHAMGDPMAVQLCRCEATYYTRAIRWRDGVVRGTPAGRRLPAVVADILTLDAKNCAGRAISGNVPFQ